VPDLRPPSVCAQVRPRPVLAADQRRGAGESDMPVLEVRAAEGEAMTVRRCWSCDHAESDHASNVGCARLIEATGHRRPEMCPCVAVPPDVMPAEPAQPADPWERKTPVDVLSPRQHYWAAGELITNGLDKISRTIVREGVRVEPSFEARAELIATAQVHAILSTVPQAQFERWRNPAKPSATAAQRVYDLRGYCQHQRQLGRCIVCVLAEGSTVSADPNADGGTMPPGGRPPCSQCGECGVPCWSSQRMIGSRCDLPGCKGTMVHWSGDSKQWYAPVEPRP